MNHIRLLFALVVTAAIPGLAQTVDSSAPGLPQDSAGVLGELAFRYDYSTFKPGHLKATYQLYDDSGKPTDQGTYEYWWASRQVYRSSWTRGGATYTVWHTADGKIAYQGKSESLNYFEYRLENAFRSPLTSAGEVDPAKFRLDPNGFTASTGSVVSCFNTIPTTLKDDKVQIPTVGPFHTSLFHTYCINTKVGVLLGIYSFGTQVIKFSNFKQFEGGKYLAREVWFREGERNILSAKVDTLDTLSPTDPALTPPREDRPVKIDRVQVGPEVAESLLVKKVAPVRPPDAKDAQDKIVLQAIIATDGKVRDLQLLSVPATPSLAASAFRSVSQWQYKPYLRNGKPVEVETTVDVTYSPGQ